MPLKPDQYAADITAIEIQNICQNHEREDIAVDFKQILFHRAHPDPNAEIDDTLADIVSFANAFGGHIIIGIEDIRNRANRIRPLSEEDAVRIANKLQGLAAAHIRPPVYPLEITPFPMDATQTGWVVIVTIPPGPARPHMSAFQSKTRFCIRDGDGKRAMTIDEIRKAFVTGPQEQILASMYTEIKAVRSLIEHELIGPRPEAADTQGA